jgi:ectoine hydroxylase-related dioxygenase (phytanoyl-CoA dioxygenase family)
VFSPDQQDELGDFFQQNGFAILRGAHGEDELASLERDLADQQERLLRGALPPRHGTAVLDDPDASIDGRPFAHYVCHITEVSAPAYRAVVEAQTVAVVRRLLGEAAWLLDYERFGIVYQDARPQRGSGYSRIGWHSDWQSGPHLDIWPSVAFTLHLDATSPANGFLRVLPGSHLGAAEGMPPGFEKVPGEVAVYADRGDVLLHEARLWHSAARGTDDGPGGIRRHLRGSWCAGTRLAVGHGVDDFVKNARR